MVRLPRKSSNLTVTTPPRTGGLVSRYLKSTVSAYAIYLCCSFPFSPGFSSHGARLLSFKSIYISCTQRCMTLQHAPAYDFLSHTIYHLPRTLCAESKRRRQDAQSGFCSGDELQVSLAVDCSVGQLRVLLLQLLCAFVPSQVLLKVGPQELKGLGGPGVRNAAQPGDRSQYLRGED